MSAQEWVTSEVCHLEISEPESTQPYVYHSLPFQTGRCNLEHTEIPELLNNNKNQTKTIFHKYMNVVILILYFKLILGILYKHNFVLVLCTAVPYRFKLYCGMQQDLPFIWQL